MNTHRNETHSITFSSDHRHQISSESVDVISRLIMQASIHVLLHRIHVVVFWITMPCSLVGGYQRFGGTNCLHLHVTPKIETLCSSEFLVSSTKLHIVITQKGTI
jgi:hypothetical protein